ncbi:unnamed protein product [Boreogadus saida]
MGLSQATQPLLEGLGVRAGPSTLHDLQRYSRVLDLCHHLGIVVQANRTPYLSYRGGSGLTKTPYLSYRGGSGLTKTPYLS